LSRPEPKVATKPISKQSTKQKSNTATKTKLNQTNITIEKNKAKSDTAKHSRQIKTEPKSNQKQQTKPPIKIQSKSRIKSKAE